MGYRLLKLWVFMGILSVSGVGCSSLRSLQGNIEYDNEKLKETYYQVTIDSHDGTELTATVFQPAIDKGQQAPLVIHAHGFGVFRISSPYSLYAQVAVSGEAALKAWKQGYWVISYDHRGFGSSGGEISLMSPQKEVKDVSSVIDWAIDNIPNLQKDVNDYRIGMVGESYGGGAQLLASVFDERIDAIVPITTWNDLTMLLEPGTPKTLWGGILYFGGDIASGFDIDEESTQLFKNGFANRITDKNIEDLKLRSLSYYCDTYQYPHADALLIQAFTDTALNVNHALRNRDCFQQANKDVRTILIQNGHNVPLTDGITRLPFYSNDARVNCDNESYLTSDLIIDWWDYKLRSKESASSRVPEFCVTFDKSKGINVAGKEIEQRSFVIEQQVLAGGSPGRMEWMLQPIDMFIDVFRWGEDRDTLEEETKGGNFRPLFIPIQKETTKNDVFGIPKIDLSISHSGEDDPQVYVGVGIKRKAKQRVELVDYQVKALKGRKPHKVELPAVSARLEAGDTIGLLVYGYHSHYMFQGPFWQQETSVQGTLTLPFISQNN